MLCFFICVFFQFNGNLLLVKPSLSLFLSISLHLWEIHTTVNFLSTKNYGTKCFMKEIYPLNNILCPLLNQSSAIMNQKIFCSLKNNFYSWLWNIFFKIFSWRLFTVKKRAIWIEKKLFLARSRQLSIHFKINY